jgi:hypothetical protein
VGDGRSRQPPTVRVEPPWTSPASQPRLAIAELVFQKPTVDQQLLAVLMMEVGGDLAHLAVEQVQLLQQQLMRGLAPPQRVQAGKD